MGLEIKGGEAMAAYLADLSKKVSNPGTLRVGFLEGATEEDGTPVAMIAAIQNFGAPSKGIPPRPFFSNMVKKESGSWGGDLATVLKASDMDAKRALTLFGHHVEGQLTQAILDTNDPPNSPVTNLLKQRFPMGGQTFDDVLQARSDVAAGATAPAGKPLIQSGSMIRAVASDVK